MRRSAGTTPPVIVGGLGGSGTRLVADLLIRCGFDMGAVLNGPLDNLLFTTLFKRVEWYRDATDQDVNDRIHLFTKLSVAEPLTLEERLSFERLLREPEASNRLVVDSFGSRLSAAFTGSVDASRPVENWGFKEPISHVFLKHLHAYYPAMRYIHVVRHGLDMAFSSNVQQLDNWRRLCGMQDELTNEAVPTLQLEYWIRANAAAEKLGESLLEDRFLLLNYDSLCSTAEPGVKRLLEFLRVDTREREREHLETLCALPRLPASHGRYRRHDLRVFARDQIDAVRRWGFEVEL